MAVKEKTAKKTETTLKPSGLTAARNGMRFVVTWKITDADYSNGLQVQYRTNRTKAGVWLDATVRTDSTSTIISLSSTYYPEDTKLLTEFKFRVRGKRSTTTTTTSKQDGSDTIRTTTTTTYNWSAWSTNTFTIVAPYRPTMTATLWDDNTNRTTFAWSTTTSTNDHRPFTDVQWQTILVKECGETDGSKLKWKSSTLGWDSGTDGASGSVIKTENNDLLAANSYTRWVRTRSRGPGGASAWRYAKHVYARPYAASIKSASVLGGSTALKTICLVKWMLKAGDAHPVDRAEVQWYIGTPAAGRAVPAGASWTTGASVADTTATDTVKFTVDSAPGTDECMWVRVMSVHDSNYNYSVPKRIASGDLEDPSGLSVNGNSVTGIATITATNNSAVPDSHLAVVYSKEGLKAYVCGIIPHGDTSVTVQCPPWSGTNPASFSVYAFQGSYKSSQRAGGQTQYSVTANMTSETVSDGGEVPKAPSNVTATLSDRLGEVIVEWTWDWQDADRAEVSWSQNIYAWSSTEEPETYLLDSTHAGMLRISNLETGTLWYIRVRLAQLADDGTLVYGPYSKRVKADLALPPGKPLLRLADAIIRPTRKSMGAWWEFDAPDGTKQAFAEICEATINGETVTHGAVIAKTETAQYASIKTTSWAEGDEKILCVRVTGRNGLESEWSDPVSVTVAAKPVCTIQQTSLGWVRIPLIYPAATLYPDTTVYPSNGILDTGANVLMWMPMTVTVTGAGAGGTTTVAIERDESYQMDRPDESVFNGFAGETVALITQTGEAQITIRNTDLIGHLDDGASYRIVATVTDGLGQTATSTLPFMVFWTHQAVMPQATAAVDTESLIAMITPVRPTGTATGDVCDIYRLSADKPELIVRDAAWGTRYVDPYPALGEFGGHRVVFRTANGDYITADNHPAWIDLGDAEGDSLDVGDVIIDFDGDRVRLPYNIDLSHSWRKDFVETHYLGGAVQGDWNPAVSRTGSIGTVAIATEDQDTIRGLRRLAVYPGICHVRTPEGSSYSADVQVSETRAVGQGSRLAGFNLSVTRVDPEELDGLTYAQWRDEQEDES
jgi:hypothetical protein